MKVIKITSFTQMLESLKQELINELITGIQQKFDERVKEIKKTQKDVKGKWQDALIKRKVLIALVNENKDRIELIRNIDTLIELMKVQIQKGVTT
jgi:NurA-like 5'-3' nuclease